MSDPSEKKRRATYQDILDAPPNRVAEIINGDLHLSPHPFAPHTSVTSNLHGELWTPFGRGRGGPGGWIILVEPEVHFGEDVLVPDLAGWRRDRLPHVPEKHIDIAPNWVCEVLSKSTERIDRLEKMPIYATGGVEHAWLVSPAMRSIETFRLVDGEWRIARNYKDVPRARISPFEEIELELDALWADIPLPTRASEGVAQYDFW